jgi:hypothetical protein
MCEGRTTVHTHSSANWLKDFSCSVMEDQLQMGNEMGLEGLLPEKI